LFSKEEKYIADLQIYKILVHSRLEKEIDYKSYLVGLVNKPDKLPFLIHFKDLDFSYSAVNRGGHRVSKYQQINNNVYIQMKITYDRLSIMAGVPQTFSYVP